MRMLAWSEMCKEKRERGVSAYSQPTVVIYVKCELMKGRIGGKT